MNKLSGIQMLFIGLWIAVVAGLFYHQTFISGPKVYEAAKNMAIVFDTSEINGRIHSVSRVVANGNGFTMENNPEIYYSAVIRFTGEDEYRKFREFANPGDSIIKHRHSDTLVLIKDGINYYAECFYRKDFADAK